MDHEMAYSPYPNSCFSFVPTEAEILSYYLLTKVKGQSFPSYVPRIPEFNIYGEQGVHPRVIYDELVRLEEEDRLLGGGRDAEAELYLAVEGETEAEPRYFFNHLIKKNKASSRVSRIVGNYGSWKEDGSKIITDGVRKLGICKKFKFTKSKKDQQEVNNEEHPESEWLLREYTFDNNSDLAMCGIIKKAASSRFKKVDRHA